jgi:hypothetical protein
MAWFGPLGELLSGIAAILLALVAGIGFGFVQLRTYRKSVADRFDELSVFFWTDPQIRHGRDILSYEAQYERIRPHLERMTDDPETPYTYPKRTRVDVEAINCLCACLTRVNLLESRKLNSTQRAQADALFGYWHGLIADRKEMGAYFRRWWTTPVGVPKPADQTAGRTWRDRLALRLRQLAARISTAKEPKAARAGPRS